MIAVEGLSYAGKTTLAQALAPALGGVVIPEYSDMAALPPFPPRDQTDVAVALQHFLRLETERAAAANGASIVVADRSPLTLIAYEFGIATHSVPADPQLAVRLYSTAADDGRILRPDGYLYLRVADEVTAARAATRGRIAPHLSLPHVRAGMQAASLRYLESLPEQRRLFLDGAAPPHQLRDQAANFVRQLAATPPGDAPAWWALAQEPAT